MAGSFHQMIHIRFSCVCMSFKLYVHGEKMEDREVKGYVPTLKHTHTQTRCALLYHYKP